MTHHGRHLSCHKQEVGNEAKGFKGAESTVNNNEIDQNNERQFSYHELHDQQITALWKLETNP